MHLSLARVFVVVALAVASVGALAQSVAKVRVYANGAIELNGHKVAVTAIDESLRAHAARAGVVWYYRENAHEEPHANAEAVIQSIIRHRLLVSLSTKPDFSDYVDENNVPHPRR